MTLQPSGDDAPAVEETKKIRPLLAWGLLGINALWLLILVETLLFEGDGGRGDFANRALITFGNTVDFSGSVSVLTFGFVGLPQIVVPLLAVLLVTHLRPVLPGPAAKPFLIVALVEYGVSALFGLIAFIASFTIDGDDMGRELTELAFFRLGLFGLLGLAIAIVYKAAAPILQTPRPAGYGNQYPGGYGQPGGWPQQGAPGQPYGQAPQGQYGQPVSGAGAPGGWPQQGAPAQQQYGQPQPPAQPGGWPAGAGEQQQPERTQMISPEQQQQGQQQPGQPGGWPQQPGQGGWEQQQH